MTIYIVIYFYFKANCYRVSIFYFFNPFNSSAIFCSVIICRNKCCMFRNLISYCYSLLCSCCILVSYFVKQFLSCFYFISVNTYFIILTVKYFFFRFCRCWIMSFICIWLIKSIFNMRYIVNWFAIYVIINFYFKTNSYRVTIFYFSNPFNSTAIFCSVIICRNEFCILRNFVSYSYGLFSSGSIFVSDFISQFLSCFYNLTVNTCNITAFKNIFFRFSWCINLNRFWFHIINIIYTNFKFIFVFCSFFCYFSCDFRWWNFCLFCRIIIYFF